MDNESLVIEVDEEDSSSSLSGFIVYPDDDDESSFSYQSEDSADSFDYWGAVEQSKSLSFTPTDYEVDLSNENDTCAVCIHAKSNTIILPCNHVVICHACWLLMKKARSGIAERCPVCQTAIECVLHDYAS